MEEKWHRNYEIYVDLICWSSPRVRATHRAYGGRESGWDAIMLWSAALFSEKRAPRDRRPFSPSHFGPRERIRAPSNHGLLHRS